MGAKPLTRFFVIWLWGLGLASSETLPAVGEYAGYEACRSCHVNRYEGWKQSYHFSVIRQPGEHPEALLGDFSRAEIGLDPADIEFAIGGHWYQRYAVRLGKEIYVFPKAWSVASQRWEDQDSFSWRKKPYGVYCIGCHATRYDPETRTSVEHTIGCEACHGPGKAHVASEGRKAIVNPADWDPDEQDLLCASCHVRGVDPTGQYYFPVGYVPGQDLTKHYVPFGMEDGESPRRAFLRVFREWMSRLGSGPPPACDLCGIEREPSPASAPSATEQCLRCHRYEESYAAHTRHPGQFQLHCLDCHRSVRSNPRTFSGDVHFPDYFRVHRFTFYAEDMSSGCKRCHTEVSPEELDWHLKKWRHGGID